MTSSSENSPAANASKMPGIGGAANEGVLTGAAANVAVIPFDAAGRCESWPLAAERLTGFPAAEILGRDAVDLLRLLGADAAFSDAVSRQVASPGPIAAETWCERKASGRFPASVVFSPLVDGTGNPRGAVLVLRDRKRESGAEEELTAAARILQEAEKATAETFARLAHQLRTPLAGMMLWTKLLEDQPSADSLSRREALQAIRACVEEQMAIIDGLSGRIDGAGRTRG